MFNLFDDFKYINEYTMVPCGRYHFNEPYTDIVFRNEIPYEKPNLKQIRNIFLEMARFSHRDIGSRYFIGDSIYEVTGVDVYAGI